MSWHLGGHRIAAIDRERAECIATCGELLQGQYSDLQAEEPGPADRCPHCTWGPPSADLPPAAIRHHLAATRAAHQGARRPCP